MKQFIFTAGLAAAVLSVSTCIAQDYPARAIRVIVTSSAGSGIDIVTRMVAQRLSEAWGKPVVVDNRLGAAGIVGAEIAARAAPDGYTLLMASPMFLVGVSLYAKLPYDFVRDFTPVIQVGTTPYAMAVHPTVTARSIKEFIAYAKARPGKINYGSSGVGSIAHLAGEMIKSRAQIDMTHITYKGAPEVVTAAVSGQIDMFFNSVTVVMPQVQSGKLRALGVASRARSVLMPDVPTIAESGMPDLEVASWYGLVAPAATPQRAIAKLSREITAMVNSPEMKERLLALGTEPIGNTPEQFAASMKAEVVRYAAAIKAAGMTPQ